MSSSWTASPKPHAACVLAVHRHARWANRLRTRSSVQWDCLLWWYWCCRLTVSLWARVACWERVSLSCFHSWRQKTVQTCLPIGRITLTRGKYADAGKFHSEKGVFFPFKVLTVGIEKNSLTFLETQWFIKNICIFRGSVSKICPAFKYEPAHRVFSGNVWTICWPCLPDLQDLKGQTRRTECIYFFDQNPCGLNTITICVTFLLLFMI